MNSIVAQDPAVAAGSNVVGDGVDLDLLAAYFAAHSPVAPPALGRITVQ